MASRTEAVYHAYRASSPLNAGKRESVIRLYDAWRNGLDYAMRQWETLLLREGKTPRWLDAKTFPSWLSQRQWDSVTRQAKGMLDSWTSLREDEFRQVVNGSTLAPNVKHELHRLNLRHAWWEPGEDETHQLARHIIKHLRKKTPFPNARKCRTMSMDGKVARIEDATHATGYRWWAVVSTLDKGKPVRIPLIAEPRLEEHLAMNGEKLANHLQLHVNPDQSLSMRMMTVAPKAKPRTTGTVIGMDWGLKNLFSTSEGQTHGLRIYAWLQQRDTELTDLTRALAKAGIPYKQSKRYRNLNRRIRDYIANETNRILNRMAERNIREIVVEDLDFRHGGLSKRMNRIISRAGRGTVKRKLQDLEDNQGVTVTRINPAYTSQECSRCGHVDRRNRPTRDLFRCVCCGTRLPADINASRTILARRSRGQDWRRIGRKQILLTLRKEHGKRCHPVPDDYAVTSAATPRTATTAPEVKVPNGRKHH